MTENTVIRFIKRPEGFVDESSFAMEKAAMPTIGEGQILLRNFYHSLDPYMRPRMTEMDSYVPAFEIGQIMDGGGMGVVVESRHPDYAPGDVVMGMVQWAEYQAAEPGGFMRKIAPGIAPWKDYLGVLGGASLTAYVGMKLIGEPRAGETLYVSAASGAVGSIAAQMGKIMGCRVVGSAGTDDKVAWLKDELGLDAAFNHRTVASMDAAIAEHCPEGIDIDFENVGGATLQAVLDHINHHGRIIMCGTISEYSTPGPGLKNIFRIVNHKVRMQGFIVSDHFDMMPQFAADMAGWLAEGKIKYRETVVEGIENMPKALVGLFHGENFGKLIVKVGHEPN
ncbi:NADP-dependent oxidoreductase [Iodidimonas sp. SYSU 1G8]|uniref:NADP-dependent oxidoreductase n=1 Tax=Iodidimonas sp. SYSU 1G8 TaxID=3133967 RepID=UPI0031FED11D